MRLNVTALAIAGAILWGACVFFVGLANMAVPGYGATFLAIVAGLYPGYHVGAGFDALLIGTVYAIADGAIGGALLGWLYNVVAVSARDRERRDVAEPRGEHRLEPRAH